MSDRPRFGTVELYEELARALDADPAWAEKGKPLTLTMTHVYTSPIDKAFFMRFEEGRLTEVKEVSDGVRRADYVLTAPPETWEQVLVSQELPANIALLTRRIKVEGRLGTLMRNIGAFNYLLTVLTSIEPVVPVE